MPTSHVNVVLVHGAWADGSSWSRVIGPLKAGGLDVVAAPLPLTSLADDVAALDRVLERLDGPVVLAGFHLERLVRRRRTRGAEG
jgi:pimeloyl-ACP methyl ester carboxylesterase